MHIQTKISKIARIVVTPCLFVLQAVLNNQLCMIKCWCSISQFELEQDVSSSEWFLFLQGVSKVPPYFVGFVQTISYLSNQNQIILYCYQYILKCPNLSIKFATNLNLLGEFTFTNLSQTTCHSKVNKFKIILFKIECTFKCVKPCFLKQYWQGTK